MTTIEAEVETRLEADKPPASSIAPTPRKKKKVWNAAMKLTRRVHLYSGIFMFPFVLLYGITGWLFNHPQYFTGDQTTPLVAANVAEGKLANLSSPGLMASEIVAAINLQVGDEQNPRVVLTGTRPPQYSGFMSFTARGDNGSRSITLDPATGDGEVRTREKSKTGDEQSAERKKNNPLHAIRKVDFEHNSVTEAKQLLPEALEQLGFEAGEIESGRRSASVSFSADVDGVPTVINCNLGTGAVSAVREDAVPETKTKNFLQRLHLSRTYSPHFNIRWFWALLVDGMVLSMVFWGLSGLIMWWQIKRTRILGGGFLVASIICTTLLVVGMHDQSAVSSGLRNNQPRQERGRQPDRSGKQNEKASKQNEKSGKQTSKSSKSRKPE